jgi:hypothetical protein
MNFHQHTVKTLEKQYKYLFFDRETFRDDVWREPESGDQESTGLVAQLNWIVEGLILPLTHILGSALGRLES